MDEVMQDAALKHEEHRTNGAAAEALGGASQEVKAEADGGEEKGGGYKSDSDGDEKKDKGVAPEIGNAVWAKVRGYPTWPGLLISEDSRDGIPPPPKPQNVLVHFFGTYDITWVESVKKVHGYEANQDLYSGKTKQKNFLVAMEEAKAYIQTGELPKRMTGDFDPNEDAPQPRKLGRKFKKGESDFGGAVPRRVRVARQLGLMPPAGGGVQGSPVKINLAPAALTQIAA